VLGRWSIHPSTWKKFPSQAQCITQLLQKFTSFWYVNVNEELKRKKKLLKSRRFLNLNALEKFRVLVTSDTMAEEDEQILKSLHHPGNTLIHTRQLGSYLIKLAPIFAAVIEEGCDQGLFKTEHPRECAEFMLAGFQFLTDLGFYPWSQAQLARRMKAFPSLIEAQLSAPKGSFSFLTE
jgi:hypothetical protein